MRMTESFASTAASVAPVLWAIGTIEMQQIRKHVLPWIEEQRRQYSEAVVAMSEASDEESWDHARGRWALAQRWWLGALPQFGLYFLWAYLSVTMVGCAVTALRWLAETSDASGGGADPEKAQFIYWSLAIAFVFITLLPMWILWIDLERWREYVKGSGKALVHLEAQVRARVEPRTTDSAAEEPPRS
ncbi:hypothetical protein ACIBI8_28055 [Streptomyces sp. NPDC050529]|uniref:hypothetical protein n=1 Tax=unclassified Streptomyces TaxID=2593676 RepID=UPI002DDA92C2|nr:hypothetical protein [Streptomyces sp. NBC_01022]WRZ82361.1 hypothetical protein OG316_19915 [Streptomyces sp. NBC_01022]